MRYRHLRFPEGRGKAVTLSYDDGVREDIKMSEIISKFGIKCTFNHNNYERLSKEEIEKYVLERGHEIAVHGANHRAEGLLRPIDGINDILSCRMHLENKLGIIIKGMAYPDSGIRNISQDTTYQTIKNYLNELDIVYARTLGEDNNSFKLPDDWYAWMPTAHHRNPELMEYIDEFININPDKEPSLTRRYPRLFYLWGHSYEFEKNNNWDLLETICEKLSGKSDIWYATNMEIYKYVKAYNSLEYSADGTIVYNSTIYKIWFDIDGTLYSVDSKEKIVIDK